ncbi:MAG: potassium-transporting ATPase subunit F [Hyphomicrobiales bacterium]
MEAPAMALDVLMTLVAVLVIYHFYAVIHPEKF